jgi:molybdate transport system regulatory protein
MVKSVLKKEYRYRVTGSLWIECEGERFFGPGRVELLERIEETGSINKAAKEMGMSYKKAWELIAYHHQLRQRFVDFLETETKQLNAI